MFSLTYDCKQFELLLSKKLFQTREIKGATILQKCWRGCKTRERVKVWKQRMQKAASKIQSAWRLFWFMQIGPRIRKARFAKSATMIQKYLKGYFSKKHTLKNLSKVKIDSCHEFFMRMKKEREANAALILRYHCKKYFIRCKLAKEAAIAKKKAAAAKKAEAEAARRKKYGYGAPPKKKKTAPKPKPVPAAT